MNDEIQVSGYQNLFSISFIIAELKGSELLYIKCFKLKFKQSTYQKYIVEISTYIKKTLTFFAFREYCFIIFSWKQFIYSIYSRIIISIEFLWWWRRSIHLRDFSCLQPSFFNVTCCNKISLLISTSFNFEDEKKKKTRKFCLS